MVPACPRTCAPPASPPLLALDARVEIADTAGGRDMALADFILGNRKTALQPGQLLTAILVPKPAHTARSHFLKLGARERRIPARCRTHPGAPGTEPHRRPGMNQRVISRAAM
ncbi:MAG: FAD binding domain-containing protein [Pseudomonadota bacterium]